MKRIRIALALIAALYAAPLAAQTSVFPQTLPANTVMGRLGGTTPGPAQAIPFATLASKLVVVPGSPFVRTILTTNTTFFVDVALGTDVAGCGAGTGAAACKTIQFVVNFLLGSYDLRGFAVTIQLANSTSPAYAPAIITGKWVGGTNVIIQGNTGSPTSVLIDGAAGSYCIQATQGAVITVQGVKLQNCDQELMSNIGGSLINFQQIAFGAPTANGVSIYCSRQSYCEVIGSGNTISGLGSNFIQTSHQGNFRASASVGATPFTLSGNLSLAAGGAFGYSSSLGDLTFTGFSASAFANGGFTVTGQKWSADSGGMIQVINSSTGKSQAPTFFLGSTAGSCNGDCIVDQPSHAGPVASACGTSPGAAGYDFYGFVTEGTTATGCVLTFASAFSIAPYCMLSWTTAVPASLTYSISATAITLTHNSATNASFYFTCKGA